MQKNISKREDMYHWHVVLPYLLKNMKIHFITSYMPNSKFKLHCMHKFCRMYKLQYTHCFSKAKTEN